MKIALIALISIVIGIATGEHYHSFLFGALVALAAVGSCYWFSFRSTCEPKLAITLLACGLLSKLFVTVLGVTIGLSTEVITSPMTFILTYFAFALIATYGWHQYEQEKLALKDD